MIGKPRTNEEILGAREELRLKVTKEAEERQVQRDLMDIEDQAATAMAAQARIEIAAAKQHRQSEITRLGRLTVLRDEYDSRIPGLEIGLQRYDSSFDRRSRKAVATELDNTRQGVRVLSKEIEDLAMELQK